MPRKKSPSPNQPAISGIAPPALKSAKKVETAEISPKIESEIAFIEPPAPDEGTIPEQHEHFQLPTRFGAVPVDEAPLGWEVETHTHEVKVTKFQHAYPTIRLPFQEVQRVEFGHNAEFLAQNERDPKLRSLFPTGANRLFFGDNLHVMRQLPSESIDLTYIDPPFFSGRNYNVIFGDKNEVREVMQPGALDPLTKEMIYIAVSVANNCDYCIHSHTASAFAKGMTPEQYAELLAVVGMASETNALATAMKAPVDEQFLAEAGK